MPFIYPKNVQDFQELVQRRPYQKIANLVNEKQDLSEAKGFTGVYLILINNPVISRLQYEAKEINPILKARFEGKPMLQQEAKVLVQEAKVSVKEVCDRYLQAINATNPTRPIMDIVQNVTINATSVGKTYIIRYFKKWDAPNKS